MADHDEDVKPPAPRGHGREVWVGVFVLVGLASALTLLFTMTSPTMFRGRRLLTTLVAHAGGVRKGDPVLMRGVVVGRVLRFRIDPAGKRVAVYLEIEGEYEVPKDSRVEIKSSGFLQQMSADIVPGQSTEMARTGDTLPGELVGGGDVMKSASDAAADAGAAALRVKALLSDDMVHNVQASTKEMRDLLTQLSATATEQRQQLAALTKSLRKSAAGIEDLSTRPELTSAIKKTDEAMGRLDEASASFKRSSASLETFTARLENGEGTLGKLSKDDTLYKNLNEATLNASKLLEDFREHPKRYVKLSFF